ncbi:cysteine dioxygenase family protein [Pelagibius sp. CAU 1746]|uniref:cysteine dioxygenase family protein n=1 Tax=Pelagibius sp. CAU 1746 TaxID=3140370 RepID=UPI00325A91E0
MPAPQAKDRPYTLENYVADLRRITAETDEEDEIIRRVGPLAQRLAVDKSWLQDKYYQTNGEQGFNAFLLHEEPDHSLAVLAVNWLPGRGAPPHDHGTWAVISGVDGVERNTRYARVDDRSRPDRAELEVKHEINADAGELICMKTGGIHSVHNDGSDVTLSLHTYGTHPNFTERSQFDLETGEKKDFKVQVE